MAINTSSTKDEAWAGDKLSRKDCADFLTSYLTKRFGTAPGKNGEESFVLNVNSSWGFGKSYFLVNWKRDLETAGYPVIYYDAWKNDFSDEPLLGFIAELESSLKQIFNRSTKAQKHAVSLLGSAKKLLRPSLPLLAAVLTKKLTNMSLDEFLEELDSADEDDDSASHEGESGKKPDETLSKVAEKAAEQALKEHRTKQKYIAVFRAELRSLIEHIAKNLKSVQLPIIVMVDELDRCRPTYAIELLENIKHIFGVPGVCFVVATDSKQLSASVKAVYGNEFDAERYLQRFFDQEYALPDPDYFRYADYLFSKQDLDGSKILNPFKFGENKPANSYLFAKMARSFGLTLRSQNQCFEMFRAIYIMWDNPQPVQLPYLFFMIFLRHSRREIFEQYIAEPQSFSFNTVFEKRVALSELFPVMQRTGSSFFDHEEAHVHMDTLVREYSRLATSDQREISRSLDEQRYGFVRDAAGALTNGKRFSVSENPLLKYIDLVRQAGQLM